MSHTDGERGTANGVIASVLGCVLVVGLFVVQLALAFTSISRFGPTYFTEEQSLKPSSSVVVRIFTSEKGTWNSPAQSGHIVGLLLPFRGGILRFTSLLSTLAVLIIIPVLQLAGCTVAPIVVMVVALMVAAMYLLTRALRSHLQTALVSLSYVVITLLAVVKLVDVHSAAASATSIASATMALLFIHILLSMGRFAHELFLAIRWLMCSSDAASHYSPIGTRRGSKASPADVLDDIGDVELRDAIVGEGQQDHPAHRTYSQQSVRFVNDDAIEVVEDEGIMLLDNGDYGVGGDDTASEQN